jgi:hypothetical protein
MDFATDLARGFYTFLALYILAFWLVFFLRRCLWRRKGSKRRFLPTYTSAGNAFQALQVMVQPQVENVLSEKLDEESEDDEDGDPFDPEKNLQRQLKRIRRGERVDRLTASIR